MSDNEVLGMLFDELGINSAEEKEEKPAKEEKKEEKKVKKDGEKPAKTEKKEKEAPKNKKKEEAPKKEKKGKKKESSSSEEEDAMDEDDSDDEDEDDSMEDSDAEDDSDEDEDDDSDEDDSEDDLDDESDEDDEDDEDEEDDEDSDEDDSDDSNEDDSGDSEKSSSSEAEAPKKKARKRKTAFQRRPQPEFVDDKSEEEESTTIFMQPIAVEKMTKIWTETEWAGSGDKPSLDSLLLLRWIMLRAKGGHVPIHLGIPRYESKTDDDDAIIAAFDNIIADCLAPLRSTQAVRLLVILSGASDAKYERESIEHEEVSVLTGRKISGEVLAVYTRRNDPQTGKVTDTVSFMEASTDEDGGKDAEEYTETTLRSIMALSVWRRNIEHALGQYAQKHNLRADTTGLLTHLHLDSDGFKLIYNMWRDFHFAAAVVAKTAKELKKAGFVFN